MTDGIEAEAPVLYVCMSCHRGGEAAAEEGTVPEGRRLFDELQALIAAKGAAAPLRAVPMLCFANCERGCTAAIASPGKWSYMLGDLGAEHAADLLTYATAYAKAATGVVLPSGRPASLQQSVIARFPAHLAEAKEAAE